jgi:hypothetical protein
VRDATKFKHERALMRFLEEGERVAWVSQPAGSATTAA